MSGQPPVAGGSAQAQTGSYNAAAAGNSTAIVAVFHAAPPRPADPAEVAAAAALLETLPLDAPPPPPRGMPVPHVMPFRRNRSFVGREPDLLAIARAIKGGGTAAVGQSPALTGMGGQGKTQLAVEFAYRYGTWFAGGVFWLDCADPAAMAEAVAACGPALHPGEPGFTARPLPERVALVGAAFAGDLPRLLVFDNCEDEGVLDEWIPKGGGCRALITARRLGWSPDRGIAPLPLGGLTRPESMALLNRHRPDLPADDAGLAAVAAALGDLPLALDLAGRYLARYRHEPGGTPAAYLAELGEADVLGHASLSVADLEATNGSRLPTHHGMDVARTFEVSLRRLDPDRPADALALEVFARAAWLSPGVPIPRPLLKRCAGISPDDTEGGRRFPEALARLAELALVEESAAGAVILHRLLAAFARARLDGSGTARKATELAVCDEADRLLIEGDPVPFQGWGTHLTAMAAAAARDGTTLAGDLLNAAGFYSMLIADFATAEALLQRAVATAEATFGGRHPEVARTLGNLGIVQRRRGDTAAAEASQVRAVAIFEAAQGRDHVQVAVALTNLVNLQSELGALAVAEANQRRALRIFRRTPGHDGREIAVAMGNLGVIQRRRGRLDMAERTLMRAQAALGAACAADHPAVGRNLVSLGILQHQRGRLTDARASLSKALGIEERAFGPRHPEVARTLVNLGRLQIEQNELDAAEANLDRALSITEDVLGPEHPDAGRACEALGLLYLKRGQEIEAKNNLTRALHVLEDAYGPDHPSVIAVRGRLLPIAP